MAIQSEEIQLRIVASGNAAKRELAELGEQQDKLKRQIEGLNKSSKDYASTKRRLQNELKQTNERMRKLRGEIDLNKMSMRDLRNRANDLKRVMDNMNPDSPEWRRLNSDLQKVNGRMKELRGSTQQLRGGFDGLKGMLSKGLMVGVAIQGARELWEVGKRAVQAFTNQAQAVAKVNQAIQSTAGAAGLSLSQLRAEASALQKKTLFGDETILNDATAQLLTFTNIANDNFLRTQRVALDLSTVLDGDLKSASIQLGKALNDPVANLSALSRSGIQFSAAQKEVIKDLAESNRLAEAQGVILDELERQYGGQAEAAAAVGGGWQQLGNILGDTMEELGGFITALFNTDQATGGLIEVVSGLNERMREWSENVTQGRQYLRDWYNESKLVRMGVQMLAVNLKTTLLWVMQVLDQVVVKPFQLIQAGIKAARLMMDGEFKQAGAVMADYGKMWADDWKQFGGEMAEVFKGAINEVRNPEPWQDLDKNSANAFNALKINASNALAQAKADIETLQQLIGGGENGTAAERGGGTTDDTDDFQARLKKELDNKADLTEQLHLLSRSAEELEIEATNAYYDELVTLADQFKDKSVDIEAKRAAEINAIRAKYAAQNKKAEEITLQEGLSSLSGALDQMEGLLAENAEASRGFAMFKLAIDTATSISSAIAGATQAAAATGPGAPFTIAAYIASMVATVVTSFVKAKKLISGAPEFEAGGVLSGPRHSAGGMAVVDAYGNKQAEVEGGEAIIPVDTTQANMPLINAMLANRGKTIMPTPSVSIDTASLTSSISGVPQFAGGGTMPAPSYSSDASTTLASRLDALTLAVMAQKDNRAIVSLQQFTDKQDDLDLIKKFSDIRST